jgi:hypothetical protein
MCCATSNASIRTSVAYPVLEAAGEMAHDVSESDPVLLADVPSKSAPR